MKIDLIKYWNLLSEKGKYMVHVSLATGLIFLLILIGSSFQINIKALNPLTRSLVDYEVTDIVFSKFKDRSIIDFDKRIIVVNTGKPDRQKIINALNILNKLDVGAIGIDILFDELKDKNLDKRLASVFAKTPNLVLASVLGAYDTEAQLFEPVNGCHAFFADSVETAYTNFVAKPDRTIRLFSFSERTTERQEVAFALKLAEFYNPKLDPSLRQRENPVERINYKGNLESFVQYDLNQLIEHQEDLKSVFENKIVLMGYLGDDDWNLSARDKFYTPLNDKIAVKSLPDMHGLIIHANILSMILDRSYITEVPNWINRLLEIIIVMLCVAIIRMDYISFKSTFWIIIRVLQIFVFILLFYLVAGVFYLFDIRLNLTIGIIGALMAWDAVDFYENMLQPWAVKNLKKIMNFSKIDNTEISIK